jgi:single-strand DNA-binding protein
MSSTIKKSVQLTGYVGKDAILTKCDNGHKKATLILATNVQQTDANNIKTIETVWHKVIAWGRLAEDIAVIAKKGSKLKVTGLNQLRTYQRPTGTIKNISEVILVDFIHLPKGPEIVQEAFPF